MLMDSAVKNLDELVDLDDAFLTNCQYLDIADDNVIVQNSENSIKIAHLNVHSLLSKYDDLIDLMEILKQKNLMPDVLLLCETFLNDRNHNKIKFPNYSMISQHRKIRSQGGVAVLIGDHIKYQEREDLGIYDEGKFESIFVEKPR